MKILPSSTIEAERIAQIIRESNKDVAELFGLNFKNAPKHPSFYTKNWVLSDFERGEEYFFYIKDGVNVGCVAFEQPDPDTAYLNRLSVLPEYRHKGIGTELVRHIFKYARSKYVKIISIGIIAEHSRLKNWYLELGFNEDSTRKFHHLPFNVTYMNYAL